MRGCPVHELRGRLRKSGLRPTRQRIALGWLLLGKGPRHVTAEGIHAEAASLRVAVSLATVYNTLHQFTGAGLLREVSIDGARAYFDTDTRAHHHFLVEETSELIDIPFSAVAFGQLPPPPPGMEVDRVDVVVRLRRARPAS